MQAGLWLAIAGEGETVGPWRNVGVGMGVAEREVEAPVVKERIPKIRAFRLGPRLSEVEGGVVGLAVEIAGQLADLLAAGDRRDDLRGPPGQRDVAVVVEEMARLFAGQRDNLKVAVAAAGEVTLDEADPTAADAGRDRLPATPWIGDVAVVVEIVNEGAAFDGHELEIAMVPAFEVALDDLRRRPRGSRDRLRATPWIGDVAVVVEIVDEVRAFANHDFEVAVIAALEVALDDRAAAGRCGRDDLGTPPRTSHVAVVVKIVDEGAPLEDDDLEIPVIAALEVALDDAARPGGLARNDLAAHPSGRHTAVVTPVVNEIAALEDDRLEIAMMAAATASEVALNEAPRVRARRQRDGDGGRRRRLRSCAHAGS